MFLVSVIVGYPAASTVMLLADVDTRTISIPFRVFVLTLAIAVLMLEFHFRSSRFRVSVLFLLFLTCWGALFARYGYDVIILGIKPSAHFGDVEFAVFFFGVSFVPALALFIPNDPSVLRTVHAVLILLCCGIILIFLESFYISADLASVRYQTEGLNAISFGSVGAILVILIITWQKRKGVSIFSFLLRFVAIVLGMLALFLSASRGPLVALIFTTFLLMLHSMRRGIAQTITVFVSLVIISGASYALAVSFPEVLENSFLVARIAGGAVDMSTLERTEILQASWNIARENPFFGGRIVVPITNAYPHNILLEAIMVGGIGLFLCVVALCLISVQSAFRLLRASDKRLLFVGGLIVFNVVMAMISGSLYTGPEFWTAVALAAAYGSRTHRRVRSGAIAAKDQELGDREVITGSANSDGVTNGKAGGL